MPYFAFVSAKAVLVRKNCRFPEGFIKFTKHIYKPQKI